MALIGSDEHSVDSSTNCSKFGVGETDLPTTSQQRENLSWWQRNPMTYNWNETAMPPEGSRDFFLEIDRRFFTSSPFFQGTPPFSALIPLDRLGGRDVLEIGCGMGSHAQLLAEAGCHLTAINLTPRAAEMTARKSYLMARLPDAAVQAIAGRVGSYLFTTATKGAGADAA